MTGNPIELHCDLNVDPANEKDLVDTFHRIFQPAISRQPGFVSVTLLKQRAATLAYRLAISFQTEPERLAWVATGDHQRVWPQMEKNLKEEKFTGSLWDVV